MDYKEKYEQALQRAKQFSEKPFLEDSKGIVEYIFPELKESEEQEIRKEIIAHIKWCEDSGYCSKEEMTRWITFLEKQGEQKPAWSEEDENLFMCAIDAVKQESKVRTDGCLDEEVGEMVTNWLKSLKDRVLTQPK